jgi:hypothetical protein
MIALNKYVKVDSARFSYWIFLKVDHIIDKASRKKFIKLISSKFGPIGIKWQYQVAEDNYILKVDNEHDAVILLIKIQG